MTLAIESFHLHETTIREEEDFAHSSVTSLQDTSRNDGSSGDVDVDVDGDQQSITSQDEALLEMLGLANTSRAAMHLGDEEYPDKEENDIRSVLTLPQKRQQEPKCNLRHLALPPKAHRQFHPPSQCCAWEISNVFTPKECQELILLAQNQSFDYVRTAMHTAPDGTSYPVPIQNPNPHQLSVFSHPLWVEQIWNRLHGILSLQDLSKSILKDFLQRDSLPPPVALNPRLRVLQYQADLKDEFPPHFDATTRIGDDRISLLTVLLYLNDGEGQDFEGGETYFLETTTTTKDMSSSMSLSRSGIHRNEQSSKIVPRKGSVVLFEHDLYHSGHPLEWGTKYVLRTDLLFELSEEEYWTRRNSRNSERQSQDSNKFSPLNDDITTPPTSLPSTVSEMISQLPELSLAEREEIHQGLASLDDWLDLSVESFCAPGRFALQLMLQEVMDRKIAKQLVDFAFRCL